MGKPRKKFDKNGKMLGWRARFYDDDGREHERFFHRQTDAQTWLDEITAAKVTNTYTAPQNAKLTVSQYIALWELGYASRRKGTVRQSKVHLKRIEARFGKRRLNQLRQSDVRSWIAALRTEGLSDSYIFALHARLAQLYNDAVQDGIVGRSPCSRRTTPGTGEQRAYVATTEQFWALHAAFPEHLRAAVLLGGLAGLRLAEVCGLRLSDVDFMRGVINPAVQYPAEPLKTKCSKGSIDIGRDLALMLAAHVQAHPAGEFMLANQWGDQLSPTTLQRAMRAARVKVKGLPAEFRFHDLRHYFASVLIAGGADIKVVQTRLRHASGRVTVDVYGHLWDDGDEKARSIINAVLAAQPKPRKLQSVD